MMCWSNTEYCAAPLYLPWLMARQLVTSLTRRSVVVWLQHEPLACLTANIHLKNKKSEGSCKSRATAGDIWFRSRYPSASVSGACAGCQSRSVLRWHRAEGTCVLLLCKVLPVRSPCFTRLRHCIALLTAQESLCVNWSSSELSAPRVGARKVGPQPSQWVVTSLWQQPLSSVWL